MHEEKDDEQPCSTQNDEDHVLNTKPKMKPPAHRTLCCSDSPDGMGAYSKIPRTVEGRGRLNGAQEDYTQPSQQINWQ
jgi:hypothetical protein